MVVVGLVLLDCCANVTNLLMARASGRAQGDRGAAALGAAGPRLVRQLLAESALLTITGAALGWRWLTGWIVLWWRWRPGQPMIDVNPDWRVLLFTLDVATLVTVLSGIAPAIQSNASDLGPALKGDAGVRAAGALVFHECFGDIADWPLARVADRAGLFLRSLHNLNLSIPI